MANIERWVAECPRCNGAGHLGSRDCEDERECPQCGGEGDVEVVPFTIHRGAVDTLREVRLYAEKMLRDRDHEVRKMGADVLEILIHPTGGR